MYCIKDQKEVTGANEPCRGCGFAFRCDHPELPPLPEPKPEPAPVQPETPKKVSWFKKLFGG